MKTANSYLKADDIEVPLLKEKAENRDATIPTGEAFCKVVNIAKNVVIGFMFHPLYSIVNALVLGHNDSPEPLAGLGLGSLTLGILALSIG